MTSAQMPPITVTLGAPLLARRGKAQHIIRKRIEAEVSELLTDLGIDTRPDVRFDVGTEPEGRYGISVFVGSIPVRFPSEIITEANAYVDGVTEVTENAVEALAAAQPERSTAGSESATRLGDVLANVCYSAISAQPELLFASIDRADAGKVDGAGEELMAALAARAIDVRIEREYLSRLLVDSPGDDLFPFVRSGLFAELGLKMPPFHIVPDASLKSRGFRFRINTVRTLPRIGLPADIILVNDTPERLASYGVEGAATLNPATWKPAALTDRAHKNSLEGLGFTTWDAWGFLILSFAAALRNSAHRLMTPVVATEMLSQLGMAFPVLARAADAHIPIDVVSSVLSELLLDGVSIRNLRQIVELLLYYQTSVDQEHNLDRMSFVRAGMADAIADRLSRSTGTVVVYLLDPQIERAVLERDPDPALPERLLAAMRDELAQIPPTAQTPSILTQAQARGRVREILRGEFPHVRVVAYGELPPSCNIQPVARLSLP
jgi:type III secretory pathway component EscV